MSEVIDYQSKSANVQPTGRGRSLKDETLGELVNVDTHDLDDAVLRAQGHEAAMPRSFSWLGAIGLGYRFSACCSVSCFVLTRNAVS